MSKLISGQKVLKDDDSNRTKLTARKENVAKLSVRAGMNVVEATNAAATAPFISESSNSDDSSGSDSGSSSGSSSSSNNSNAEQP